MIVGNGLIASLFKDSDLEDVVFFASGVSNSLETRTEEFQREENLIRKTIAQHPEKTFVYFSTCSIYDSSKTGSAYVLHKLKMEQIITNVHHNYLILRVSNVVGKGGNPNLLMNYLMRSVKDGTVINVHTNATRNLIDAEDVKNLTFRMLAKQKLNRIINCAYLQNYSIIEILEIIEREYQIRPQLNLIKSGSGYEIIIPEAEAYFLKNNLNNKEDYLCGILRKYY